ncbi:imm11 family protein [Paenibacillus sp. GYB003]|uniref:imm11 family protein n=1 Tax=Paenibacillus sp. GYB003 TaxID=2994392 RepID=UPI002F96AC72
MSKKGNPTDCPQFSAGIPVFSEKAITITYDFLKDSAEILPLNHDTMKLFALNVIQVLDAIDYEKAIVRRNSNGRFTGFEKFAFKKSIVQNHHIFKIPEYIGLRVFVSDEFRTRVIESNLTGFKFDEMWDSEEDIDAKDAARERYNAVLEKIEREKGKEYSYKEAISRVETKDIAIACGKFKWQKNKNGKILMGELIEDGTYIWMDLVYVPVTHLELKWHIVEKSDIQDMIMLIVAGSDENDKLHQSEL